MSHPPVKQAVYFFTAIGGRMDERAQLLLSTELLQIFKDGLKAQGWLDADELVELKLRHTKETNELASVIRTRNNTITQMKEVLEQTRLTLMDAYQKSSSLSAHGCATIAARIEESLLTIGD